MTLWTYNTLTRKTEEFIPLNGKEVKVYVCGLTVYDHMHIGHARTYIAFDAILRYLKYKGYNVRYVQNITDIDDKIIKKAKERNVDPLILSAEYAQKSAEDMRTLGLLEADAYPKVSENIDGIISAVEDLVKNGCAYVIDGDVYFNVSMFPEYGRLSNQDTEGLTKHRIEPNPKKKTSLDFVLWKKVPVGELGFQSPWGFGRPGWHIECSALARKYLGDRIDIHGGALDLIFPHHENEIAQSESLTGKKPYVKYWMHTGFLQSSGEKMSKSLGNIVSIRDYAKGNDLSAYRLFVLQTHYRSPIDYSGENVSAAENSLEKLRTYRKELEYAIGKAKDTGEDKAEAISKELRAAFEKGMDDDYNTTRAFAAVYDAVRRTNPLLFESSESKSSLKAAATVFDGITGVFGLDLSVKTEAFTDDEKQLIDERNAHRKNKNYSEADRLRKLLLEKGIKLNDKGDGTTVAERTN
jgi:cysteinyl-tRNA synthetase